MSKSAYMFVLINGPLIAISYLQYLALQMNFLYMLGFTISRNLVMTKFLEYSIRDKAPIKENYVYPDGEFLGYIVQASVIEAAATLLVIPGNPEANILYVTLAFIPMSFIFEVLFDFFHYWAHRTLHIYANVLPWHKTHHTHIHLKPVIAFYQGWMDIILTNVIPFMLTERLVQSIYPLSSLELSLLLTYKIFIEISGHLGHKGYPSSFPQCIWIPRALGIELYCEDHDIHHTNTKYNFAKRFTLWDKVFKTKGPAIRSQVTYEYR